ncbi:MAG: NAD(P)-binding domain-containing protein [Armatimonadetes bacterium]|nr:NAD(P)-binding domain-containing protein [Armatimonadota bacterium]
MRLFDDAAAERLPAKLADAAGAAAFRALGAGAARNPTRSQRVGRPGEPEFLGFEMPAELDEPNGAPLLRGCKRIEEPGERGADGQRVATSRRAWIELCHLPTGRRATVAAGALTDLRTGISAVWAAERLAPVSARLAVIGTGKVARQLVLAADRILRPELIRATSRSTERRAEFRMALQGQLEARLEVVDGVEAALAGADVAFAAVPASEPVLTAENSAAIPVLVAVEGDPRAWQVAPEVFGSRWVVADLVAQAEQTGSVLRAGAAPRWTEREGRPFTLPDASAPGGFRPGPPLLLLLTGLAVVDLLLAYAVWLWHDATLPPCAWLPEVAPGAGE